ncbi:hypothetical protein CDL15_Pgr024029 [Punica granatum]|uniref:Uncharacterized protein n=1 Tax=Punica granatum TaxID=22663 RepID=A0A218XR61_PUNGR|nr:hypothetical protein CDL15_Pgr024029 [Punica granatum]
MRIYFHASKVRRACSLVLLATLPGLLTRMSLLMFLVTLPSLLTRESLLSCSASSPSLLDRASCNLARTAQPYEFTFRLRKFAELFRSCFLQPCWVCSPVRVYLCFLQPCRVRSPLRVYFHAPQVRRACSIVRLETLLGLLTPASLFSCFPRSMSVLSRAFANLAKSAHSCEFIFMLPKFAEPALSCFLQTRRVSSPVRVYFHASHVRGACSLLLLATSPGLLTRASLLSGFPSSPSLLAPASCNLAECAHPCEFTFRLRKFAELARSCFLQPCRFWSAVRVYFHTSQVRRACSFVLLATLPSPLTHASLLSFFPTSPSLLVHASCNLARTAQSCEFTFMLRKFVEPARSWFLQSYRVCSPVSAPHFGPPASHTRIPDRSPGHYSSPGNQRQIGGHGVMNKGRRARSLRKAEESHQKSERTRNPQNDGAGTVALFITESPKH